MFDHASVLPGTCSSCHDGVTASGKDADHIPTVAECDDCHTTVAWLPAMFDHTGIVGNCSSCHNSVQATGKGPGHFITAQDCNICHETAFWVPSIFMHTTLMFEPLDHAANLACTACHQANSEPVNWQFPAYQPDCAGCHANDFEPGKHDKIDSPPTQYTAGELRDCTGACHVYTDPTLTVIDSLEPGPEHRISDSGF